MCTNQSPDFSNLTLEKFFRNCDTLAYKNNSYSNNLITYLAWSSCKDFDSDECLMHMSFRIPPQDIDVQELGCYPWEDKLLSRRFKLLSSNNKAFGIATKPNPTVLDLEEFSQIDPCFAILYPVKIYLANHPELAVEYHGMLPFGREVIRYYNTIIPEEFMIKGSPTFRDHVSLRNISNKKAIFMGVPSLTINNLMYQFGKSMNESDVVDSEEE